MSVLILGAGNIGRVVAYDLAKDFDVTVADIDDRALDKVRDYAVPLKFDVMKDDVISLMEKYELVVDTLPGKFGFYILKSAIKAGVDLVDVSFMPEDPMHFEGNITVVVDAGFAPGLSNVVLGHIYKELGELDDALIRVGGLPKDPQPPLYYTSTWSPEDLLEEYTRKARIVRDGKIVEVEPLENISSVKLENYEFEEFLSDGLRTLLYTIPAKNMEERTLRWPGHLEKMKVLKELGLFEPENREMILKVLLSLMKDGDDFCIMEVYGKGRGKEMRYFMYDEARDFTSMARVTGYTAAVIARIVMDGELENGIIAPEYLGMNDAVYHRILELLKDKGIEVREIKR